MHGPGTRGMRARFVAAVCFVAVASVLAGCATSRPTTTSSQTTPMGDLAARPNIVFVLTDDLSANLVRYMPHVLAMQRRGVSFTNYFVTDSLCCPSRTSILTGLFPHNSGVFTNGGSDGGFGGFVSNGNAERTFALALERSGYRTGLMGKYLNGYLTGLRTDGRSYIPPGWTEWAVGGSNGYREFDYNLNVNRRVIRYGASAKAYLTDVLSRRAAKFVSGTDRGSRQPFMLEVSTFAPHAPYVPAPRDARRFAWLQAPRTPAFDENDVIGNPKWLDRPPLAPYEVKRIDSEFRSRVRAVQAVDRMIGELQHRIAAEGLARNTYFVFSSDNGFHMGEHRLAPGKMTAFDTDIKVPLVIVGPGIRPGTKISALAENIDLAPTFQELAGLTPSPSVDGRSLVPLLAGEHPTDWRRAVLVEHHGPDIDPGDPDYPEPGSGNPPTYEAMRFADAVYVEYRDGEREYYDIANDPFELRNVFARVSEERRAELHDQLRALARCQGARSCHRADRL